MRESTNEPEFIALSAIGEVNKKSAKSANNKNRNDKNRTYSRMQLFAGNHMYTAILPRAWTDSRKGVD